ncbi:MAG: amidohydrolase family protein, partial [Acidobacteriota bacterium]
QKLPAIEPAAQITSQTNWLFMPYRFVALGIPFCLRGKIMNKAFFNFKSAAAMQDRRRLHKLEELCKAMLKIALMFFISCAVAAAQTKTATQTKPIAFTRVTIIDVVSGSAQPGMTVIITGDRITEVGQTGKIKIPRGAQIIDARGKFLIPGLWDMHTHLQMAGETALTVMIARGVTGARDMGGGDFSQIKEWREKISRGTLLGPRIKAAGPILESPRFIARMEQMTGQSLAGKRIGVANADDARKAIASIKEMGADFIKIRTNASRDAYFAIVREARLAGLMLVGHTPTAATLVEASDAGQHSMEHGFLLFGDLKEDQWKEICDHFTKNGTYVVPTLISGRSYRQTPDEEVMAIIDDKTGARDERRRYVSPSLVEDWRMQMEMKKKETPIDWKAIMDRNLRGIQIIHRAGVRLMAGTDLGVPLVFPGSSLHEELELLVKQVGLTPLEAIQSATLIPAEFFNMRDQLGSIEKGKLADMVLLDANPMDEIANTRKIAAVVVNGRLITRSGIRTLLADAAAQTGRQ